MPKALERSLKRKVAGKNWSEERKDAYVYGTLRKTGWKPSTQKKMSDSSKVIRLQAINERLDKVINFQNDDDDYDTKNRRFLGKATLATGATAGLGAAGLYGAGARAQGVPWKSIPAKIGQNVQSIGKGGLSDVGATLKSGIGEVKEATQTGYDLLQKAGQTATPYIKKGYGAIASGIGNVLKKFKFNARTRTIRFAAPELNDPGAGQFGGTDPGIAGRIQQDNQQVSALQRLKLKLAKLRGMGLQTDGNSSQP